MVLPPRRWDASSVEHVAAGRSAQAGWPVVVKPPHRDQQPQNSKCGRAVVMDDVADVLGDAFPVHIGFPPSCAGTRCRPAHRRPTSCRRAAAMRSSPCNQGAPELVRSFMVMRDRPGGKTRNTFRSQSVPERNQPRSIRQVVCRIAVVKRPESCAVGAGEKVVPSLFWFTGRLARLHTHRATCWDVWACARTALVRVS